MAASAFASSPPAATPLPNGGALVTAADWRTEALKNWRNPPGEFGDLVAEGGGVKLITTQQPEFIYSLQMHLTNQRALRRGETLLLRFAARSLQPDRATGATKLRVSFGGPGVTRDRGYAREVGLSADWQRIDLPFACPGDLEPQKATINFSFGYPAQTVELADVRLVSFGSDVPVASLPRTQREADPWAPEAVDREVARIAALHRELTAVADPAPAHGKQIHVAASAAKGGDGSVAKPFATIPAALAVVQPGDTILVGAGDYLERAGITVRVSGRPEAWIKIKAAPGTRPKIISSGWSGFGLTGGIAYVEIAGFELAWVPDPKAAKPVDGVGIAPAYASHHLRFLDNIVHGFGTGGICSLDCDYLHLEGNVIYDNCKTSPYGGSAISLCRAFNCDEAPGYHNVVRRNICYDNELLVPVLESSGGNGRILTDGNGIIIDVFKRSRANPLKPHTQDRNGPLLPFRGRTLIENNLMFNNGGRGIHIFRSEKVDVINNTCYLNQKSADINAGEFTAIEAGEVTFFNNIAFGRPEKRGNSQDGSRGVLWRNNLITSSDDILRHPGLISADPRFTAPGVAGPPEGFRLAPDSPALGRALAAVAPADDLAGATRVGAGPIDLGAYQSGR